MTSQNGLPEQSAGSRSRRRSLYEELGLEVDLFDAPDAQLADPPPRLSAPPTSGPEAANGAPADAYGYGPPSRYSVPAVGVDETESFIESLRATDDRDAGAWMGEPRAEDRELRGLRRRHADAGAAEAAPEDRAYGDEYAAAGFGRPGDPFGSVVPEPIAYAEPAGAGFTAEDLLTPRDLAGQRDGRDVLGEIRSEPVRNTPTSAQLTEESVLRRRRDHPSRGWRRAVYTLSVGQVNPGPSRAEIRERELVNRARTPLRGCHRLAVISLKGGVGKTTTTACLGSMFATLRGDRVIAMDANPDRGTLGEKIPRTSARTVRDMVNNAARLARYADVRDYTSQAPSRLEVIASDADPFVSMAFSETDYRVGIGILESYYNLILTDCGTGLLHSAMVGVLGLADSLIVVSSASLDGARSASATLDWLEHHGYDDLVRHAVAVISTVHPNGGNVDVSKLEDHFAARCCAVVRIPFDRHLEAGGIIDLDELEAPTYEAYLQLAAAVGDGFAIPPRIG